MTPHPVLPPNGSVLCSATNHPNPNSIGFPLNQSNVLFNSFNAFDANHSVIPNGSMQIHSSPLFPSKIQSMDVLPNLIQQIGTNNASNMDINNPNPNPNPNSPNDTNGFVKNTSPPSSSSSSSSSSISSLSSLSSSSVYNSSPNLNFTTQLLKILCSNPNLKHHQLETLCAPLLKLVIKQVLDECLPRVSQITIQGQLELHYHGNDDPNANVSSSTHLSAPAFEWNKLILNFDEFQNTNEHTDDLTPCPMDHIPLPMMGDPTSTTNHHNIHSIMDGHIQPTSVLSETHPNQEWNHSRRKSQNPSKYCLDEMNSIYSHHLSPRSSPTSPSTDSGVLDLSRSGSLAGSAPITPMKNLNLWNEQPSYYHDPLTNNHPNNQKSNLVESYHKQLMIFNQLHNLWKVNLNLAPNGASHLLEQHASPHVEHNNYFENYSQIQLSQPTMEPRLTSTTYPLGKKIPVPKSAPNSPHKVGRKTRTVAMVTATNRLSNLRRPNSNRRFPCNQCREEFPSLHILEEHTLYQHGTYRCHICNAQFTQRSNLQRHALKHVGFKPFECKVCAKAYYRKDHLMRHMEMGHPGFVPRENITVHLTSSESLDFLNRSAEPESESIFMPPHQQKQQQQQHLFSPKLQNHLHHPHYHHHQQQQQQQQPQQIVENHPNAFNADESNEFSNESSADGIFNMSDQQLMNNNNNNNNNINDSCNNSKPENTIIETQL